MSTSSDDQRCLYRKLCSAWVMQFLQFLVETRGTKFGGWCVSTKVRKRTQKDDKDAGAAWSPPPCTPRELLQPLSRLNLPGNNCTRKLCGKRATSKIPQKIICKRTQKDPKGPVYSWCKLGGAPCVHPLRRITMSDKRPSRSFSFTSLQKDTKVPGIHC
jgi:hypothetical protein